MRASDVALAAFTSVIWGLGFLAIKFGLQDLSAPQLTAVRFLIASLATFVVPRPNVAWYRIVLIGLTLFTGQFLLLFFAYTKGMPPGLASVTQQSQAFFTVPLAAVFLRDVPSPRHYIGMTIAFAGLTIIALTMGSDVKPMGLGLALAAAFSWAVGNVLVKGMPTIPTLSLVAWASLIPPVPALILSTAYDRGAPLWEALFRASWLSVGAAVYLGAMATVVAYAVWGKLLQRYPAAVVAPFALLASCTGVLGSAVAFGEVFSAVRYAGMALILLGVAEIVVPVSWGRRKPPWSR